jgi:multicomponent Na+:H+ antiporter subunit F
MIILYLILAAILLCIVRAFLGPTAPDRVIAIDTLGILVVPILVLFSIQSNKPMLLDLALAYAFLAFIGTIAISKYLEGKKLFH